MHKPVLLKEVLEIFNPKPGETYIDATINGGGHSVAIATKVGPGGMVLGIDWDCPLIEALRIKNQESGIKNLKLICENYANLGSIVAKHNLGAPHGVLFDLGFSSYHLEEARKGFSFLKNEPLDMRYSHENKLTAEKIINLWQESAIAVILRDYGEERFAKRIARGIIRRRNRGKIQRTRELVSVIEESVPRAYLKGRIHPATRTFQALRIAVNDELGNLQKGLQGALEILRTGGKIIVIAFHSLEDRIVKNFFRKKGKEGIISILTQKPITATEEELTHNLRARSAKLRAAVKISR